MQTRNNQEICREIAAQLAASDKQTGETDYGYAVRMLCNKAHKALVAQYVSTFERTCKAPPFGQMHKTASKRWLAVKIVEMDGKFDKLGNAVPAK